MPRVVGIDHLVLSVGDLARSKDFYGGCARAQIRPCRHGRREQPQDAVLDRAGRRAGAHAEAPQGRHQLPSLFAWSHFRTENRLPLFLKMLRAFELRAARTSTRSACSREARHVGGRSARRVHCDSSTTRSISPTRAGRSSKAWCTSRGRSRDASERRPDAFGAASAAVSAMPGAATEPKLDLDFRDKVPAIDHDAADRPLNDQSGAVLPQRHKPPSTPASRT